MSKIENYLRLVEQIKEIHLQKNEDYGDSAHETFEEFGAISYITRMSDKWNRIKRLTLSDEPAKVKSETIKDSLLDLANYCLMLASEYDEQKPKTKRTRRPKEVVEDESSNSEPGSDE